jgi:hypothetical protein
MSQVPWTSLTKACHLPSTAMASYQLTKALVEVDVEVVEAKEGARGEEVATPHPRSGKISHQKKELGFFKHEIIIIKEEEKMAGEVEVLMLNQ